MPLPFDVDYGPEEEKNSAAAKPPSALSLVNYATQEPPPTDEGGFIPAVKRTVGQTIRGVGQAAADILPGVGPENIVSEYGQEVIEANPAVVTGFRDIAKKPLTTVAEATGVAAPSVAGIVGIRALGQGITAAAPLTGPAAPIVAGIGQAVSWLGPTAIAALPAYSGIRDKQALKDPEAQTSARDKFVAALGASTIGVIEQRFGPQNWAKALVSKEGRQQVAKLFASATKKGTIAKGAAKGALVEGAEEIAQSPVEQLASYESPLTKEAMHEAAFSGVMGTIGGGVLGGGFGAISPTQAKLQQRKDSAQQQLLASRFPDADIAVSNDTAVIVPGEGQQPITMNVKELAEHLADGGTLETVPIEYRFGERGLFSGTQQVTPEERAVDQFQRETVTENYLRNRQGLRAAARTTDAVGTEPDVAEGLFQTYQPLTGREDFTGRQAATIPEEEVAAQRFEQDIAVENYLRNRQGLRTAARTTDAVGTEPDITQTYQPLTGREDFTGRQAAELTPAQAEAAAFEREALEYNQRRNLRGVEAAAAPTDPARIEPGVAEGLYQAYQPEAPTAEAPAPVTTIEPEVVKGTGKQQSKTMAGEKVPDMQTTGVKVRYDAVGAGPTVFEIVRREPRHENDLPDEAYFTIKNTRTGELQLVERADITPVKGQEAAFQAIPENVTDVAYSSLDIPGQKRDTNYKRGQKINVETYPVKENEQSRTDEKKLRALMSKRGGAFTAPLQIVSLSDSDLAGAARKVGSIFRKRFVFFQTPPGTPSPAGIVDRNDPGVIYVNTDANLHPLTIIGHELVHVLRKSYPTVYKKFRNFAVKRYKKDEANEFKRYMKGNSWYNTQSITDEMVFEEMLGNFVGDSFVRPDFWNDMAQQNPTLFKKFAETVSSIITKLKAKIQKAFGKDIYNYGAYDYFLGANAVRKEAAEAMSRFATEVQEGKGVVQTAIDKGVDPSFSAIADEQLNAGRKGVELIAKSTIGPLTKLKELATQYAPQWLSVTPLRTLVQTYGKNIPQIQAFANRLDSIVAAKSELVDTSAVLYEQAEKAAKQAGISLKEFNKAAFVASFNQMTPWEPLLNQEWVPTKGTTAERLAAANTKWVKAGMKDSTGMTFAQAHKEASDAYKALKTQSSKDAYIKIVAHLKEIRQRERNNLLTYIESVSEEGTELRTELMSRFNTSFNELRGAYWPLTRFGDFILEYTDKSGWRVVEHFTTLAERRQAMADLAKDGVDQATMKLDMKDKLARGAAPVPQELMAQLSAAVEKKYVSDIDPNNEEAVAAGRQQAQAVLDDMNQIWLRWQPETSALKNSIRRKSVRGAHDDMLRGYLDYVQHHAGNIAWTEQGRKIEDDIKSLADDIVTEKESGGVDVTMKRHLVNDLRNRVQALRSANVGKVASNLGKLSTFYYMTSPSIALVQMSQLGLLTLPKLGVMYGGPKAAKALGKWTKEAFSAKYTRQPMFEDPLVNQVFEDIRAVVTEENRGTKQAEGKILGERLFTDAEIEAEVNKLSEYQRRLLVLREAMARNLLDISAAHEAYDLTQGKDPRGARGKIFRLAMLPMSLSELTSRKSAVLATYDLATQEGKNFVESMQDISDVVNDTLYSYSKENKGSAMQGGISRVLLQFQHYRIMTGIRLALLFKNAVKGETPEVRKEATKEFIGVMGMTGALAGSFGLPMANLLFAALDMVLGDDDEPVDSKLIYSNWLKDNFGKNMAAVLSTGLPSLLGADLSRRTGLAEIYGSQQEAPEGLHGKELAAWHAASQLGPVFSVTQSWFQGYDEMVNKGQYMRGLETASPKPIRDIMKAIRIGAEGVKTRSGKKLLADEEIGVDELVMLALGFNADEVSKAQAAERSLRGISTRISERRGRLIKQAAESFLQGGTEEDMLRDIRAFNNKMPRFGIDGGDIRAAVRKILRGELGITGKRDRLVAQQFEVPVYM